MTPILRASAIALATVVATGAMAQSNGNDGRGGGASVSGNPVLSVRFSENDHPRRIRRPHGDDLCPHRVGIGPDALIVLRRCDHRR